MTETLFEPIGVHDINFHVRQSIEQCPPGLQQRELLQNAFETEVLPEEAGKRRVEIRAHVIDGVTKLAIYNTGHGMTEEELVTATDLSSSIRKTKGLTGRANRGEGAKVASLPWNGSGMIFRSCREGEVSEAVLARYGDVYARKKREVELDDGTPAYGTSWNITEEAVEEGYATDYDWTEVTLLGNVDDQEAAFRPYGPDIGSGDKRSVLTEIVDRFYDFPDHVEVFAEDAYHGRKSLMELRPMARAFKRHETEKTSDGKPRVRRERVPLSDGIEAEFVHLPLLAGSNNALGAHELAGDATRGAIVWQREMYDPRVGMRWKNCAASFGLPAIHRRMSFFIHIPDNYRVREGSYRQRLVSTRSGEEVELDDFQEEVRACMPDWVKALVQKALEPKRVTDMDEVKKELQRRLRKARIKGIDKGKAGVGPFFAAGPIGPGDPSMTTTSVTESTTPTVVDPNAPVPPSGPTPLRKRKKAKSRAALSIAPDIQWLDKESQVDSEQLEERAGKYNEPTNTLYLNALHGSVAGKVDELEEHYARIVDIDQVRDEIIDQVKVEMALAIGTVVVNALAKQGLKTWDKEHREKAFSSESLTVAAEATDGIVSVLRSRLSNRESFRAARVS